MEWYNVIAVILGALGGIGGLGGLVGLYKAKAEKTGIDINNLKEMLDEAHKMFNAICEEKEKAQEEFSSYKAENMKYIAEFKERFRKVETRLEHTEEAVFQLKGAIYRGYRCKFPTNIEDCPVIKEYEKVQCEKCNNADN